MSKQIFVFLGPPGVGKGTQAAKLAADLKLPHISTGDLFRDHLKRETEKRLKLVGFRRVCPQAQAQPRSQAGRLAWKLARR